MSGPAVLAPLLFLAGGAVLVLLLGTRRGGGSNSVQAAVSVAAAAAAGFAAARLWGRAAEAFGGQLRWDEPALFLTFLYLLAAVLAILLGMRFVVLHRIPRGEYYGLLLLAVCGLILMTATRHLLVVFLGLEVFSVSAYALTGLNRRDDGSAEAAAKYFLTGSFASAFFVFGSALLFGAAGTLDLDSAAAGLAGTGAVPALPAAGLILVLCGLGYKIAVVPFHMYFPDVTAGAPTPAAAFFAAAPKAAGFAVLLRILFAFARAGIGGGPIASFLSAAAVATMILGNFAALRQRNLKRLLAYSGIAHAGYMLIAVVSGDPAGLLFYLANYRFMGVGAFAAVIALAGPDRETLDLDDYAGLGRRSPWAAGIFAVILVSLAGFPPTGGFLAKFFVFSAAVRAGRLGLALAGIAASLVSVAVYLRVVRVMFMKEPAREIEVDTENYPVYLVLFFCLYAVLQLGLFPGGVTAFLRGAAAGF